MSTLNDRKKDIEAQASKINKPVFSGELNKNVTPKAELQASSPKLVSLEEL